MSKSEVKFQKFIGRLRKRFGYLFITILKKQLLLKKIITESDWDNWKNDIRIDYVRDNHFTELKDNEILRERIQALDMVQQYVGIYFTKDWVLRNILKMGDEDIKILNKEVEDENKEDQQDQDSDNEESPTDQ